MPSSEINKSERGFGAGTSPCSELRCWGGCCILTLPPLPKPLNFPQLQPLISQQSDTNTVSLDKSSAFTSPTLGRVRAEGVMILVMIKTSCCSSEGNSGAVSCRKKDTKNLHRLSLSGWSCAEHTFQGDASQGAVAPSVFPGTPLLWLCFGDTSPITLSAPE